MRNVAARNLFVTFSCFAIAGKWYYFYVQKGIFLPF